MKNVVLGGLAALLLGSVALPAVAADLSPKKAPVAYVEDSFNPWMIRVRALGVLPDATGTTVTNPKLTNSVVPEIDVTYFLTRNWAVEVIAGVTPHTLSTSGTSIVKTLLLPPTATLQYHVTGFGAFVPYVGAGANYTWFLNNRGENGVTSVYIKPAAGFALQAGFDYMLNQNWGLNVDVKKLFLRTTANVNGGTDNVAVNIDPWIVGVGVTYKFGSGPVLARY